MGDSEKAWPIDDWTAELAGSTGSPGGGVASGVMLAYALASTPRYWASGRRRPSVTSNGSPHADPLLEDVACIALRASGARAPVNVSFEFTLLTSSGDSLVHVRSQLPKRWEVVEQFDVVIGRIDGLSTIN